MATETRLHSVRNCDFLSDEHTGTGMEVKLWSPLVSLMCRLGNASTGVDKTSVPIIMDEHQCSVNVN